MTRLPPPDYDEVFAILAARWHPAVAAIEAHLYVQRLTRPALRPVTS